MENCTSHEISEQGSPEVPSLIKYISSNEVAGFDSIEKATELQCLAPSAKQESEKDLERGQVDESVIINHQRKHSVSISMPLSPEQVQSHNNGGKTLGDGIANFSPQSNTGVSKPPRQTKCYSQPMMKGNVYPENTEGRINFGQNPHILRLKDRRFDPFKTFSGKLERQISILRGKPPKQGDVQEENSLNNTDRPRTVDRYYDALEGPELETLRTSEETVLPQDEKWPFLLRFPISSFGMCLGVSSQAILWKTLATSPSTEFLHISLKVNLVLWIISIVLVLSIFVMYLLKIIIYFEAVRREYYHPIRVNFFFAPWIALLFLVLGVPPSLSKHLHHALWYILMVPIFCLELKIYGQWMSGGQRRLSKVANPSNHLSIVGNFVGALLGASMGLKEGPIFFFAVGLAHYTVLFVTLYQRLPTNETLPKELHPVFFLFVAAPSVASMAWARIQGSFDNGSRIAYFIALFLYFSLAVRINFFRGFKFSLSWWAYTFPMTGAAVATIRYSVVVTNVVTKSLCVILSLVSTLIVTALLITTIIHAFVLKDLFPNDIAIAISDRKRKTHKNKWFPHRHGSNEHSKVIEAFLKFATTDGEGDGDHGDLEAALEKPTNPINEQK
ncbi:hypothetical protein QN277_000009 [Acacia crassicarpa]|uniref:S-type anion channel SLAH2-like n=1 Tax=Acacia crassicarpa TaxID=499986 RepID=A0AAE1N5K3_9FABA|nr:hypothetical protein QN277_000009 [Acacia crassicarpa]